ncbi:MAG: GntR family transcriptional regulator [Candidatus Microbacterium colombiense]|nr:MAG: GntR family transcriptional regulator [Microbacterium sp.]
MRIALSPSGGQPTEQIRDQIRGLIATGGLAEGQRLPSVRQLAQDLGVAPRTVAKAYKALEESGALQTRVGSGTRVAEGASATPLTVLDAARDLAVAARREGMDVDEVQRVLRAIW